MYGYYTIDLKTREYIDINPSIVILCSTFILQEHIIEIIIPIVIQLVIILSRIVCMNI